MLSISKGFVGVQALSDVTLRVDAGEIVALVGENGAGKSTLIKILSGAQHADGGEIRVDGEPANIRTPLDAERLGIATVYQELNLFPSLSVTENLLFGRYPRRRGKISWREAHRETEEFLTKIGVTLNPRRLVGGLSIAEQQMLEIAKALHREVRILILDEPTAVLGGRDVDGLMSIVRSLRDQGVAVIFISHRLQEVFDLTDHYLVLKDGAVTGSGRTTDTDHDRLVTMMVGRDLPKRAATASVSRGPVVLEAEGVEREGVLRNINLVLHRGEAVGLAGLRGAGRTELARALFGADPIDAGNVKVDGRVVSLGSPDDGVAAGMGLVPEDRGSQGLFRSMSVAANVSMVTLAMGRKRWLRPAEERRIAAAYGEKLAIRMPKVTAPVQTLSGGNQQKVVLAKWLEAGVSVLILDEPTRGVDVGSKREIYDVIHGLCEQGLGVLLISSELPELLEMSDRILVMHQGEIAAEMDRDDATEELIMHYAVGGGDAGDGRVEAGSVSR
jgi:ABC-type sugar transport system ATPase subunit